MTPTRRWVRGGCFYEYAARFVALLPMMYYAINALGLEVTAEKRAGFFILAASMALGLLVMHLELEVVSMTFVGEKFYTDAGTRLLGKSPAEAVDLLAGGDQEKPGMRKGQGRGVVWADPERKHRTGTCLVFLHGWSASRLECSPVCEDLAKQLGANCYFGRLPGHGRREMAWKEEEISLCSFVQEICEALALGQQLGERVILVGASTGAALCAWVAAQEWSKGSVAGCILFSTNVRTRPVALIAGLRRIPFIRELVFIFIRGWTWTAKPNSPEHAEGWTQIYPSHTMAAVFDVSAALDVEDPKLNAVPTLAFHNPEDEIASYHAAQHFVSCLKNGRFVPVTGSENSHCIVGSIQSPSQLKFVNDEITKWLKQLE